MRTLLRHRRIAALTAACSSLFWTAVVFAQTQSQTTTPQSETVRTTTTEWYAEPWVWPVGVAIAVFLIVVIALTNRGSSRRA